VRVRVSYAGETLHPMPELFRAQPIRPPAQRGVRSMPMRRPARDDVWPRPTREPGDVAIIASRLLVAAGRLSTRVRTVARRHDVDPQLVRLLLLFAESDRPLRIGNIAEFMGVSHPTASRAATRAHAAGLIDKFATSIDGREVTVRITAEGRAAVSRCLDALRTDASEVFGLTNTATVHPRAHDLCDLLGPAPAHQYTSDNFGWRAGVRVGMRDE
jgi:DNA-binding MarR family transcriptional regulator